MARPLNKRPVGEEEQNTWTTFAEVALDPLPHDPERLRKIVRTLLGRFEGRNPKEARYLSSHILRLASVERRYPIRSAEELAAASAPRRRLMEEADTLARELLQSADEEVLDILSRAGIPRSTHAADTLRFQRDLLTAFLTIHPYPIIRTTREKALKEWMQKNASPIWQALSTLPCYCTYRPSYDGLLDSDLTDCLGPAPLIELFLAELHYSTRSAIRKVLSHPSTR